MAQSLDLISHIESGVFFLRVWGGLDPGEAEGPRVENPELSLQTRNSEPCTRNWCSSGWVCG